jgi:hypothetical protein
MRQSSSSRASCGGRVSAAGIKPARSGLIRSAAFVKLLPSHGLTRCRFPSSCLGFLCSPMSSGTNCVRCSSPRSPSGVAKPSSGADAWRPCSGWPGRPQPGGNCPKTSGRGKPSCTITVAGAKQACGSASSRFSSRQAPRMYLPLLFPLPNGLSGAVVLRACLAMPVDGAEGIPTVKASPRMWWSVSSGGFAAPSANPNGMQR